MKESRKMIKKKSTHQVVELPISAITSGLRSIGRQAWFPS